MSSFVVLSLYNQLGDKVCDELAKSLDMHYLNLADMIEYELIDKDAILNKCGIDYLNKRMSDTVRNISTFENTIIFVAYDILLSPEHRTYLQKLPKLYIRLTESYLSKQINCDYTQDANGELVLNVLAYADRDAFLSANADETIVAKDTWQDTVESILKYIKEE